MGGRKPSPAFQGKDGDSTPVLDVFVPDNGDRTGTATYLTEAAGEDMQRHVRSDAARRGFWISNDLADIVYDDSDEAAPEPEPEPTQTPDKAPAKTGSTTKKKTVTQKGSTK
jgi:hypothetical protein